MLFSKEKSALLHTGKELKLVTFLVAVLTASCFFVPYIVLGKGYFIFFGDFNVQQIPFYKMCHAAVRSGNFAWSTTTDLGANFIGSYSFYLLGSPFFWITLPFPTDFVPFLMGPLLILKFGCAALTAYLFIRRFTRTPQAAMLGGLLYAFSGFSVYNIFFNHFHEAIIVLPLLLLSMELLITENRRGLFGCMVAVCAIVNYFFFFGMVVFCVVYYIVRLCSHAIKFRFSRFLWMCFEAILGLGISAFLLFPSILAILGNYRVSNFLLGWDAIMYGKEQIYLNIIECFFFPPDLPARPVFFPNANVKWSSLGGWLPLLGMTGVISYMSARKGSWVKRLICVCAVMALIPILNSAFYAFNSAYYARWFYMPILIMALATAVACEDETVNLSKGIMWSSVITAAFALTIGLFPRREGDDSIAFGLFTQDDEGMYLVRYWITVLIAAICLVVVGLLVFLFNKNRKRFIRVGIAITCVVSVVYAGIFIGMGRSHSYDANSVMIDSLIEGNVNLDGDKDAFRIDTYSSVDNTGMYLGYSSINAFHSIVPASVMEFYDYIGVKRDVGSRPDKKVPAIRSLLSVKYLLDMVEGDEDFIDSEGKTAMSGYKYLKTSGGYYVYENENFVPYGFSYDFAMSYAYCDKYSKSDRSRMMLKAMLLSKKQMSKYADYITDIETVSFDDETEMTDLKPTFVEDQTAESETVSEDGATVSEQAISQGEQTESMSTEDKNAKENDELTLALSDEEMAKDAARLAKTGADSFKFSNGSFTAKVTRDKKALVFFSVPYDKGWTAEVNGKTVKPEKVNVGFMAVPVDKGTSTITFTYHTPGLNIGLIVSGGALIIFIIYLAAAKAVISHREENETYPEGEKLLVKYKVNEIDESDPEIEEPDDMLSILDDIKLGNLSLEDEETVLGGFNINNSIFEENAEEFEEEENSNPQDEEE